MTCFTKSILALGFGFLFSVIGSIGVRGLEPDASLVLYLTFDEDSEEDVKDLSQYGNDGTLQGDPKWVNGMHGKAFELKAEGDYIEIPDSDSLDIEDEISLLAWIFSDEWTGNNQWIDKGNHDAKPNGYGVGVFRTASTVLFMLGDGGARQDFPAAGIPPEKKWVHIAAIYDGKAMTVYMDGEVFDSSDRGFAFNGVSELPLNIGRGVNRSEYGFLGIVDEVAVFNRALSQSEIKEAMLGIGAAVEYPGKLAATWGDVKSGF